MWPAALRSWNAEDPVQEIHMIPTQMKKAASSQARVHGQDDLLREEWRCVDRFRCLDETRVLLFRELPKP